MELLEIIKRDHKKKSNQLRRVQKKLKNKAKKTLSLDVLKNMLAKEKSQTLDYRDYYSWGEYNENSYRKDDAAKEARIQILEELIRMAENKKK